MADSKQGGKPISLALQGGGAHGAFTWGVLDCLLEDGRIAIEAITATSAGAMNAVALASGMHENGVDGARASLEYFWRDVSQRGAPLASVTQSPISNAFDALSPFTAWSPMTFASMLSNFASPYDFNPFDFNPLRETLRATIDFEAVHASEIALHIAATNVETGRVRVFTEREVTIEAILASACLPQTFKAVEIDGVPYWDGGYMGNPALFPLIYTDAPADILLVLLNPLVRRGTPRTAGEIQDRMNEISFNSALMGELRAISFVRKLLDENWLADRVRRKYRRLNLHGIDGGAALSELSLDTKFDTRWRFLTELRDSGRALAKSWLDTNHATIGKDSTIDIHNSFLSLD